MPSHKVRDGKSKHASRLVKSFENLNNLVEESSKRPSGIFGASAKVKSGSVLIESDKLDLEFVVTFDDDMEVNESEIIIYNLSDDTVKKLKYRAAISIEAGYTGDTGVVFSGFIDKVSTTYDGPDKITTIRALDDIKVRTVESVTFAKGTKASYILRSLVNKTGLPVAVFKTRRDHTYKNTVTIDGDLMSNIKRYSEVCGISTYILKGRIYARHITDGDNIRFQVSEDTGMIGSPTEYEEEITAEDYKDIVSGYDIEMLLQHRMQTAAIISLKSRTATGTYRVRSGEHRFNASEAVTEIKVM